MAIDDVTAPTEAHTALSNHMPPDNNTNNPPVNSYALSATSQEVNGGTTSTIDNIPVGMVRRHTKIQIWRKRCR